MPASKFQKGDKVRLRRKGPAKYLAPDFILSGMRGRTRRIASVYYDENLQANLYDLAGRGKSVMGYLFRSYQLVTAPDKAKPGRPKMKRRRRPDGVLPYRALRRNK